MDIMIPKGSTGVEPALLSFTQVREILNVGATKLRELVRDGHLVAKLNGRQPMIEPATIKAYVAGLAPVVVKARAP